MTNQPQHTQPQDQDKNTNRRVLSLRQMQMIDKALQSVGPYGEVRLVVKDGELRVLITQKSIDTLKWKPGSLNNDVD
jgi:hypothetical protein